jgi:rhodanese-related sulfurtransferase
MRTKRILLSLMFWMGVITAASTLPASKTGYQDPGTLEKLIRAGNPAYVLIDVRTQLMYEAGHIATAINIPIGVLDSHPPETEKDSLIIVYGTYRAESDEGQKILNNIGYQNVVCFNGFGRWMGGLVIGPHPGVPSTIPGYGPNDDELFSVACNSVRTDDLDVARYFVKRMKEKNLNFEDIYFSIHCDSPDASGLMFHYSASPLVSRAFLSSLRAYEKNTGKTVVEPILNRLFPNHLFSEGPNQTLLDYLSWRKEGKMSAGLEKLFRDLIELYRSYGAKYSSELDLPPS